MVQLPRALPAASGWYLADRRRVQRQGRTVPAGLVTLEFVQLDPDERWLIDRVVVQTTSSALTTLCLYESVVDAGRLLDLTSAGNLNTADYPSGLLLLPSTSLVAQWTGASAGSVCTLTAQVRVERRV